MLEHKPPFAHPFTKLPGRLTPFIGRRTDLGSLLKLLEDPSIRLVTISGPGGIGKTALALEIASQLQEKFEHGAAFVPLAQLGTVDELLPALAGTLDVQLPPNGDLQQAVLDQLAGLQLLLVLDSFEHLLEEAVLIREILLAAPRVKVLITSREKLNLEAETLYNLGGLDIPLADDLRDMPDCDSISLFLQRARQVRPGFSLHDNQIAAVIHLCRMLDGNPLGILLAASWVEHLLPAEISAEAERSLDFLTHNSRDVEPRHSSLRAVFESSFDRLDRKQKDIFRKLAIFRGGFDLAAAQAVAGADLLSLLSLAEKSMLVRAPETGRYELHGLLRQYAQEELSAAGEIGRIMDAHEAYYCSFVRQREPRMLGDQQAAALDEVQADLDNIRQAWNRLTGKRDFESVRLMLPGLYAFCDMRSRFYDGEAMFRQAVDALAPGAGENPEGAWALALLSWYDMRNYIERFDSYDQITSQASRCLEQAKTKQDAATLATSLVLLGAIAGHQGDYKTANKNYRDAMEACPALDGVYWVIMRVGLSYEADRQYDKALAAFQVCLDRGRRTGEAVKTGWSLQNIGDTLMYQGKLVEAETNLEQALSLFKAVGTRIGVLWSIHSLSRVALGRGDLTRARELAQEAARLARQVHSTTWIRKTDALLHELHLETDRPQEMRIPPQEEPLSERELEVLHLLKSELTGPEIASRLVVSLNTVRFHTKHIYQKLGVNSRLEAIHRAKELGL
jgi:predicted ATPase